MRTTLICSGDPERIDGWRCPHCQQQLPLDPAKVREHAASHLCLGCSLESLVVEGIVSEQLQRRTN